MKAVDDIIGKDTEKTGEKSFVKQLIRVYVAFMTLLTML